MFACLKAVKKKTPHKNGCFYPNIILFPHASIKTFILPNAYKEIMKQIREGLEAIILEVVRERESATTNQIKKELDRRGAHANWLTVKRRLEGLAAQGQVKALEFGEKNKVFVWTMNN